MINAVDLFCGAGGLTHGLVRAGIKVRAGVDCDKACQYPFEFNNDAELIERDVRRLSGRDISEIFPKRGLRLLAGCAPCQPFSLYTQGRKSDRDPKWSLLEEFARIVKEVRPELVTMENVATLTRHRIFALFKEMLERLGYFVTHRTLSCADYGLPQTRDRLVLVASRLSAVTLPAPSAKRKTVRETIEHLPAIKHGESHPSDRLHKAASLSDLNLRRISVSKPGGTWRDWPTSLRAECHQKASGMSYPSVYGRMAWDLPAPTMTTQCHGYGNGRFGHPEQHRAISLREAALFQSFPQTSKGIRGSPEKQKPPRNCGVFVPETSAPVRWQPAKTCSRTCSTRVKQCALLHYFKRSSNLCATRMAGKLTDIAIRNAKPRAIKYTMSAGKGLTLLVMPDGAKYWRLRYKFGGRARWLSVGKPYPEMSLKEAETHVLRLRALIDKGIDPAEEKAERKLAQNERVANTFGEAAEAWHKFRSQASNEKTSRQVRQYLDKDMLPRLRARPVDSISAPELGDFVRGIEGRQAFDVALKMRQWLKLSAPIQN